MKVLNLVQNTPEWHEFRRAGIGGSDAPVINLTSPYKTPIELAREKIEPNYSPDDDASKEFIFAKGHRVEGLIRKEFQELVGEEILPVCFIDDQVSYRRASLDGFSEKHGVLEAKLVGQAVLARALTEGEIPEHHFAQMQHQFQVSGADVGQWFGHDGSKHGALITVKADREYQKRLMEQEAVFWENLQKGILPPLTERDYLDAEGDDLLSELREAKVLAENAEIAFKAIREKVVEKYKHPKIAGYGLKLFKVDRQGSLDLLDVPEIADVVAAARAKLDPKYLESFRKKGSSSWTVRIDTKKVK